MAFVKPFPDNELVPLRDGKAVKWYEGEFKFIQDLETGRILRFRIPDYTPEMDFRL